MRLAPCIVFLVAACEARLGASGQDSEGEDQGLDAAVPTLPDAAPIARENACGVATDQGNLGTLTGTADVVQQSDTSMQRVYRVGAPTPLTASDPAPDIVVVELYDDYGAFTDGPARTGTFTIIGDEADYDTCGICVLMLANFANDTAEKVLLATAGTVTVTSIGAATGEMTQVSLANASFVEISFTEGQGAATVAGSDCPSPISNGELRGTL